MKKMAIISRLLFLSFCFSMLSFSLWADDVVIIGANSDNSNDIAFVATTMIPAGTTIYFTDNEWGGVGFNSGEGILEYTAPAGGIAAGTVVTISPTGASSGSVTETGNFDLANGNDVVYAYYGTDENTPTEVLTAFGDGGNPSGADDPTGDALAPNVVVVSLPIDQDNADYNGTRVFASVTDFIAAVTNDANYTQTDGTGDQSIALNTTSFNFNANISFEALVDCDDNAGTSASFGEMYVHISNVQNVDGVNTVTFSSNIGTVTGQVDAGNTSASLLISGITASDFGNLITLTADNNGTTQTIEIPIAICGYSVDTGGDGNMEDDVSNGVFCTSQNGSTAPGILTQVISPNNILSGNNITSSYTYVLVDNTNSDAIIASNNTGIFDAGDGVSNMNTYTVYAFYVSDTETDFATELGNLTSISSGDDILTGMGAFANLCYNFCCSAAFTPNCCNADAGDLTTTATTTNFIICEGLDLLDDAMASAVFTNDYAAGDETDPNVNDPGDYETAYITADASGNIIEYNTTGDFDFSNDATYTGGNTYSIYALNYKVDNTPTTALAYLAALSPSTIAQIQADDSDTSSGGAGGGTFCLDLDGLDATGTPVTVTILDEPDVDNQTAMACSDVASNVTLGASTNSIAVDNYNITNIELNGLSASAGNPVTADGVADAEIADDAFTNTTGADVDVIYTVVPVSADGCEGDPFTVTLTVKPEPVGSDPTPTTCSDVALNVTLQDLITNGLSNVTFSWSAADNTNVTGETTSTSTATSITDVLTNTSGAAQTVIYTVTPTSATADGACTGDPFTVTVMVDSEPVVDNQTAAVCSGSATGVTLGASTNGTAVATYDITNVNVAADLIGTGTSGTDLAADAIENDVFTNPTSGSLDVVYTVTPVSAGDCAGDPFTVTVTIDPMVDVDLSSVATDLCYKSVADLIDLSGDYISGGTNTGTWSTSGDGVFNDASNEHPTVTGYTTGTVDRSNATVTLTLSANSGNTCPNDSDNVTITIRDVTCTNNSFFSGDN